MGSSRVGQRSGIRAVTCVVWISLMNLISNGSSARENWPESRHEFIWPCGSQCSVFHFSSHICISYCFDPIRSGQIFGVDRFGGYLFTKRSALDAFLSGSSANDADRHLLKGHHLLRALEEITSGTGQVHDEQLGDGFLLTAPEPWYALGYLPIPTTSPFMIDARREADRRNRAKAMGVFRYAPTK